MKMPRFSSKQAAIMELLAAHGSVGMYGLDMVKRSEGKLKRGTIYPTLSRMEERGLVSSDLVDPQPGQQGPARRQYRLTGMGQRAWKVWLAMQQAGALEALQQAGAPGAGLEWAL